MVGRRASRRGWVTVVAIGASIAVLVTGCRRPPGHGGPGTTAAPSTTAAPTTTAAPSTTTTMAGHDHGGPGDDHGHGGPGVPDDKGWSELHNGHQAEHGSVPLDEATQRELDRQVAVTQQLVARFPNVAAATAAGYRRAGPFAPGLGAHYMPPTGVGLGTGPGPDAPMTDEQLLQPMLVFNGTDPDSVLVGFMYSTFGGTGVPEGFVGPNDHWHYHTNVCVAFGPDGVDVPLGADREITTEQCTAAGGRLLAVTGYMVHLWSVPGWENPDGLFAELNPKVTCKDGTYHMIPLDHAGATKTYCRDEAGI